MPVAVWIAITAIVVVIGAATGAAWAINRYVSQERRQPYGQLLGAATSSCVALIAATVAWQAVQRQLDAQSEQLQLQRRIASMTYNDQLRRQLAEMREVRALSLIGIDNLEVANITVADQWINVHNSVFSSPIQALNNRKEYLHRMELNSISLLSASYRANLSEAGRNAVAGFAYCVNVMSTAANGPLIALEAAQGNAPDGYELYVRKTIGEAHERMKTQYGACKGLAEKALQSLEDDMAALRRQLEMSEKQ